MNRRQSHIPTLLAANVRPVRRRPLGSAGRGTGAELRLSYGGESRDREAHAGLTLDDDAAREDARRILSALRVADAAIETIQEHLRRLEGHLRPTVGVRRRSPQEVVSNQAEIDSTIQAIDDIVGATEFDGQRLLRGGWSATLTNVEASGQHVVCIRSMETRQLGDGRIGFLASAGSGCAEAAQRVSFDAVRAIVGTAMEQAARQRERLAAFGKDVIHPVLNALRVAAENVDASERVLHDADFAIKSSELTRADALVNASKPILPQPHPKPPSVLRAVRG